MCGAVTQAWRLFFPERKTIHYVKHTKREAVKYNEMIHTNSIKFPMNTNTHGWLFTSWSGVAGVEQCSCLRLSKLCFNCCEGRDCCLAVSCILHGRNQSANAMKPDIVIGANESQLLRPGETSSFHTMHWTFHRNGLLWCQKRCWIRC